MGGPPFDSEQCSNRLQLDLISRLVKFLCELDQIMTRLPMGWRSDSEQYSNRFQLNLISRLVNFLCQLGQIMTRYDLLWAR